MDENYRRSRLFSLDSLKGYNENYLNELSSRYQERTRQLADASTQTDFRITYPQVYKQALEDFKSDLSVGCVNNPRESTKNALTENCKIPQNKVKNLRNKFENPAQFIDNRVSMWIDDDSDTRRISNCTMYEEIEDVISLFDNPAPNPPLPPRHMDPCTAVKRKNLCEHLGLENLNQSSEHIISAQKIALENLQSSSKFGSRKDLNLYLGLSESPVKLRKKNKSNQNRHSFMKMFKGWREASESSEVGDLNDVLIDEDRGRKRLDDYYDDGIYDKSRSSSFSSTMSSGSSSVFSSVSSLSMKSTNSVSKLFRTSKAEPRKRHSVQSMFESRHENGEASETFCRYLDKGLPIIPFSKPSSEINPSSARQGVEKADHSLDAVIHLAKLELLRNQLKSNVSKPDDSIYMEMSPNLETETYIDMSALKCQLGDYELI